ncbi:unnamed protein product [Parnassius apollo]|uniref:(apollo) hypothetical protein n=1 Tax=Parnassius apollo TaxID=110799 RepID=A0A8S3W307_PARAO|nr:unnamed protein product [Parnassius apollo]
MYNSPAVQMLFGSAVLPLVPSKNGTAPSDHGSRGRRNFSVRRPRGSRGRGPFKGKPNDRTTTWRNAQNAKVIAQADAAREARFASIGLEDPSPVTAVTQPPPTSRPYNSPEYSSVQFLGVAVTSYAQPLQISTPALGFMVNQYYIKLQEQLGSDRVSERCTIHQLYRCSLAQPSYHLYRLRMEQVPRYSFRSEYPDAPIIPVDSLECFKTPTIEDEFTDFMARNPIPGLAVAMDRITNVEAVMPRNYGPAIAYRDASTVRALMNYTAAKMRDVELHTGRLGQIGEGSPAILLKSTASMLNSEAQIPTTATGILEPVSGTVDKIKISQIMVPEEEEIFQSEDPEDPVDAALSRGNPMIGPPPGAMPRTLSYAQPLQISTPALGFMVNQYYIKLQEQLGSDRVSERCTIHQLYRCSLAQPSYHLYRLRMEQVPRYSFRSEYPDVPIIPVDSLECFKTPTIEDEFTDFMARNPIPGLAVAMDRITNVEAVMPRNYGPAIAYRDASAVRALMNYTAAKMRDVELHTGRLGQIGEGSPAILLKSTASMLNSEAQIPTTATGILEPVSGTVDKIKIYQGSRGRRNFSVRRPRGSRGRCPFKEKPNDRTTTLRNAQNAKVIAQADAAREARFASIGLEDPSPVTAVAQPPPTSHVMSCDDHVNVIPSVA